MFYESLWGKPRKRKVYEEGVMVVTVSYFSKWSIRCKDKVTTNKGVDSSACIVSDPFCATLDINDEMYLPQDGSHGMQKPFSVGQPNAKFVQILLVNTARDVTSYI